MSALLHLALNSVRGRTAAAFALAVLLAAPLMTTAEAAPYWCGNVRYNSPATEKAICDNPGLWGLDAALHDAYDRALYSSPHLRRQIKRGQARWLKRRNRCRASVACIRNRYNNRIYRLEEFY